MYGYPPSSKISRKSMSPTLAGTGRDTSDKASVPHRRLDIIRQSSARPRTPACTVGDIGDARVRPYSSFTPNGVFDGSVMRVPDPTSPMERSRIATELRRAKKIERQLKQMEHDEVVAEFIALSVTPKLLLRRPQFVSPAAAVPMNRPESTNPSRPVSPASEFPPPRPTSRHTEVRMSRPNSCLSYGAGVQQDDADWYETLQRPLSAVSGGEAAQEVRRPPLAAKFSNKVGLSRPNSAWSTASTPQTHSLIPADTSLSRPMSASPYSPLMSQPSALRVNEVLRTSRSGSAASFATERPSSGLDIRPMRSFVS